MFIDHIRVMRSQTVKFPRALDQSRNPLVEAARRAEQVFTSRNRGCGPGGPAEAQGTGRKVELETMNPPEPAGWERLG